MEFKWSRNTNGFELNEEVSKQDNLQDCYGGFMKYLRNVLIYTYIYTHLCVYMRVYMYIYVCAYMCYIPIIEHVRLEIFLTFSIVNNLAKCFETFLFLVFFNLFKNCK